MLAGLLSGCASAPRAHALKRSASVPGASAAVAAWPSVAVAPVLSAQPGPSQEELPPGATPLTLDAHAFLSGGLAGAADWIDGFFGTVRDEEETNRTEVRLRSESLLREGGNHEEDMKLRASLVLPRTEERLKLVFSGNTSADDVLATDPLDELETELDGADEGGSGLGAEYFLLDELRQNAKLEAGVRFVDGDPSLRLSTRYRRNIDLDPWLLRVVERVSWLEQDGFESITTVDFDKLIGDTLLYRSRSELSWYEDRSGVFLEQNFSRAAHLNSDQALVTSWHTRFVTSPRDVIESTRLRLRYRIRLSPRWAFVEVGPDWIFPRDTDYSGEVAFLVRLDLFFGKHWVEDY